MWKLKSYLNANYKSEEWEREKKTENSVSKIIPQDLLKTYRIDQISH